MTCVMSAEENALYIGVGLSPSTHCKVVSTLQTFNREGEVVIEAMGA